MKIKKFSYIVLMLCMSLLLVACGSNNRNKSIDSQQPDIIRQEDGRTTNTMDGYTAKAKNDYYQALDELSLKADIPDTSDWEGDTIGEKWSNRLWSYATNVYYQVRDYSLLLVVMCVVVGVFLGSIAIKNNGIKRFGFLNILVFFPIVIFVFVIGIGLFNHFYLGV